MTSDPISASATAPLVGDPAGLYSAYASRDPRFDGVFYVGVTSTGIYCRPICTARTARAANCKFFRNAEAAEKASFRPCLRCRPELAPGNAPVDDRHRIANLVAYRIEQGMLDNGKGLEQVAASLGWSSRQVRRIVHNELGVSPIELVLTRRLLIAKQLLTETVLPVTEVAFASGFASLRRFNDAFSRHYGIPPTRLRNSAGWLSATPSHDDTITLQLAYRPPFDWHGMLRFLAARALAGAECVQHDAYLRSVRIGHHTGSVRVTCVPERHTLLVELAHSLVPVLPAVLTRVRALFDLSARPDVISGKLMCDPVLAPMVARNPGLRVPGAFDGFELAVRAILGQQISVKAATTLAGRYVAAFGTGISVPNSVLTHLSPAASRVADLSVDELAAIGIVRSRAGAIITLAREVASGKLALDAGADPESTIGQLVALPGIGPWTAHYVVMRALGWPDAFPREDAVLRKELGGVTAARADEMAETWRPWRSYATLHLWQHATSRHGNRQSVLPPSSR